MSSLVQLHSVMQATQLRQTRATQKLLQVALDLPLCLRLQAVHEEASGARGLATPQ